MWSAALVAGNAAAMWSAEINCYVIYSTLLYICTFLYSLCMHNRVADCIQKPQHHTRYVIWNAKQEKVHRKSTVQNRSRNVKSPKHTHMCSSHMFSSGCFQWEKFAIPNQHHKHFYKQSKICFFRQPPHQIITVSFVLSILP